MTASYTNMAYISDIFLSLKLIFWNNKRVKSFLKAIHVFKFSLVDAQLIKRGKENETNKPAIE